MVVVLSFQGKDSKSRILLIESGVNPVGLEDFLCKDGHKSFLSHENSNPLEDSTGHGTMMVNIISQYLNPHETCIVIYKTYSAKDIKISSDAYGEALRHARNEEFIAAAIAIEDTSYFLAEPDWYRNLAKRMRVFVPAGNGGHSLSKLCQVYPACLQKEIDSESFRVVGGLKNDLNHDGPVNEVENALFVYRETRYYGTSVSTARAIGKYVQFKK